MYGLDKEFEYFQCDQCGCMQIKDLIEDYSDYYPEDYYAFVNPNISYFKKYLKKQRFLFSQGRKNILNRMIVRRYGLPDYSNWVQQTGITTESEILDVGSGTGRRLFDMCDAGFRNITGIDPFIKSDIKYNKSILIKKCALSDIQTSYDFIMLNHSLEHIENQFDTLNHLYKIIKPKKYLLIRIPIIDSFAWQKYESQWIQLDPPRHIYIHSLKSMEFLAAETGFRIARIIYDSNEFQFYGSEQIIKNIALCDKNSHFINPSDSIFSKEQIKEFRLRAKKLNKSNLGDQACFYLLRE